jgi:low temperature requirement protein LtrA
VSKSIARFSIFEKQEVGLYFQTLMLFTVFFSLVLGAAITGNFKNTVIVYSVALSCIFLVQLNVSLFLAKRHDKSIEVERND